MIKNHYCTPLCEECEMYQDTVLCASETLGGLEGFTYQDNTNFFN